MLARTWTGLALLILLGAGLWWMDGLAPQASGATGTFDVFIVGPAGEIGNGSVFVPHATALSVLTTLARERGFNVTVESAAGFGGCDQAYVRSIAGVAETTSGGWNYYTRQVAGNWTWQPVGAACHGMALGEQLEWCWVEQDVCRSHH